MARYKVLEVSFINNRIHQPGEIVDVAFKDGGEAGPNLQAVDANGNPLEAGAPVPTLPVHQTRRGGAAKKDAATRADPAAPTGETLAAGDAGSVGHTDLV